MNESKFYKLIAENTAHSKNGIGTLSEKTLHALLKRTYADSEIETEIPIGSFVADVFDGQKITEIQTANYAKLRRKLDSFLKDYPVTVVYPLVHRKRIIWMDPSTGELSEPHSGHKTGIFLDAFHELWQIMEYLPDPKLSVELVLLDVDEYRLLNGWSKDHKSGSSRVERIPTKVFDAMAFHCVNDYRKCLPENFPKEFSAKDLTGILKIRGRKIYSIIHVFEFLGIFEVKGRDGRAVIYRLTEPS